MIFSRKYYERVETIIFGVQKKVNASGKRLYIVGKKKHGINSHSNICAPKERRRKRNTKLAR